MSFDIKVNSSGLEKIRNGLVITEVQLNGTLTLEEVVIIAERTLELARQRIPFKTGAARDSLQMVVDASRSMVTIGSDGGIGTDGVRRIYLRYLELGTSKMTARPFLLPSLFQAIDEFQKRFPVKVKEMARINIYK